jgi:probable HAF family extracellular repeat protein
VVTSILLVAFYEDIGFNWLHGLMMNAVGQCRRVAMTFSWPWLLVLVLVGAQPTFAAMYDVIDLVTLGGTSSQASGVNNAGQIVGYANTLSNTTSHAALWNNSGSPALDLGTPPGGGYSVANAINDAGQIVGQSTDTA